MNTENSIYALNSLITINNDRIECYQNASKRIEESDLKVMFSEFQKSSQKIKASLVKEIQKLGGTPNNAIKVNNPFSKIITDIRALLNSTDSEDILSTCEYDDFVAFRNYNQIINENSNDLSYELKQMLIVQQAYIKADHDKIKDLNDMILGFK